MSVVQTKKRVEGLTSICKIDIEGLSGEVFRLPKQISDGRLLLANGAHWQVLSLDALVSKQQLPRPLWEMLPALK